MKTPANKQIEFLFVSHPAKIMKLRWTAKLTFPPGSDGDTLLPLSIADGEGAPVDGVFELAGQRIPVRGGQATLLYRDFVEGRHSVPLWLHRKGMPPVPGGLTFG